MKKLIWGLLIFGVIAQLPTLAQSYWQVKTFAGVSDAAFLGDMLIGGSSVDVDRFQEYGVRLSWKSSGKWGIESGFTYSFASLSMRSLPIPGGNLVQIIFPARVIHEPFELVSIPVLATYEAASYLSFQTGPVLGYQLSNNGSWMEQSGIGYLVGVNFHHYFDRLGVFVQPNFKQHAAVGFNQNNTRLTELGLQFGLAYRLSSSGMK